MCEVSRAMNDDAVCEPDFCRPRVCALISRIQSCVRRLHLTSTCTIRTTHVYFYVGVGLDLCVASMWHLTAFCKPNLPCACLLLSTSRSLRPGEEGDRNHASPRTHIRHGAWFSDAKETIIFSFSCKGCSCTATI